jgi:hypothetical protein
MEVVGYYGMGRKQTEETKLKISLARKGKPSSNKNKPLSEEHKQNISKSNIGKILSEEHKRKIAEALKGKPLSEETKLKMSLAQKGEKGSNWQGGLTENLYPEEWNYKLKNRIRERDNYTCQECGLKQENSNYKLPVHHIDYNKDNCNTENLITLCIPCHSKTNYTREDWIKYFQDKMATK